MEKYSSCDVSDALGKLGVVGHLPNISCITGGKIVGPAYTAEFTMKTNSQAPIPKVHHVDSAPKGSIIVIKAPDLAPNAVWGGLMTTRAKVLGVCGAVIEGRVRDKRELKDMDFGVYGTGSSTMGAAGFVKLATVGEPVTFAAASPWPVTIKTGDWIIADEDGVVCVPKDLKDQVLELCSKLVEIDEKCMQDVMNGSSLVETFQKHRN